MKWMFESKGCEVLVDANGRILARVRQLGSIFGPWCYGSSEYISKDAAKAAAEKDVMRIKP